VADLELKKRHRPGCPFGSDPYSRKCRCAIRIIGRTVHGVRVRVSMKTCDWARAARRFVEFEASLRNPEPKSERRGKPIAEAVTDFIAQHAGCANETIRKYSRLLGFLVDWTQQQGLVLINELTTEILDHYQIARGTRSNWTKVKEIELLRQFLNFCLKRKWCEDNPAVNLVRPKIHEANDVEPYTHEEVARILAATGSIGRYPYERLRARAMVLLLRHTGLRISDVITLSRDHIKGSYLDRTCIKNKAQSAHRDAAICTRGSR
jgi:integrase